MIKYHLGCGKRNFGPDWIHVDKADYPHIKHKDIYDLGIEYNTVDLIYSSHMFSYLSYETGLGHLDNWWQYLKPGGCVRLAVPDFSALASLYLDDEVPLKKLKGPLLGKWEIENYEKEIIQFKALYDYDTLYESFVKAGYRNIQRWDWRAVDHSVFDDYSQAYYPHMEKETGTLISLNMEGYRQL